MPPARADEIDAAALAAVDGRLERDFKTERLPRLAALGAGPGTRINAALRFSTVEGRVRVAGALAGAVELECQRCLGPVSVPVATEVDVVLVESEAAMDAVEPKDALIADAGRLDLAWLVEEEALLALPLVPLHDAEIERCIDVQEGSGAVADEAPDEDERRKPFANLRDLLDKG